MDFFDSIRVLYVTSKVLCLAPFAFVSDEAGRRFQKSNASLVYAVTASLIFTIALFQEARWLVATEVLSFSASILQLIATISALVTFTSFFLNVLSNFLHRELLINITNEMGVIRREICTEDKKEYLRNFFVILFQRTIVDLVYLVSHFSNMFHTSLTPWRMIYFHSLFIIMELVSCTMELQFTNATLMIGQLFTCLRERLSNLISDTENLDSGARDEAEMVYELRSISVIQAKLVAIAANINLVYGLPMLVNITRLTLSFVDALFGAFLVILGEESKSPYWRIPVFSLSLWIAYLVLQLFLVAFSPYSAIQQSEGLVLPLLKLTLKTKSNLGRRELRGLSLQLLSEKVAFAPWGFFRVDMTLLYSIVASVTTYLVVGVQFHLASDRNIYVIDTSMDKYLE